MTAVGEAVIDLSPAAATRWAIEVFGSHDKAVLRAGILLLLGLAAALLGLLATRRRPAGPVGAGAFGAVGVAAALTRPGAGPADALPALCAAVAAGGVLALLTARLRPAPEAAPSTGPARRRFLAAASGTAAASALAGLLGGRWRAAQDAAAEASRAATVIPPADAPAAPVPAGASLDVPGLGPFLTPNRDFYRIDTALRVPRVDAEGWRLRIHGIGVPREVILGYQDLLRRELVERDITLTCVSNPVGGRLVGNARWTGVRLAELLREAGVRAPSEGGRADQLLARSVDGMTLGSPVEALLDGRDALLAVAMNGEPLPFEHGFPVRMVVPGLYGYVSACKWLTELELTTFAAWDAYWVRRGWAAEGPVKTQSRIDTPRPADRLRPGTVPVAGVAWAQHTGISRVEVRVDGGPWQEATLAEQDTVDTWRQWVWYWAATEGEHEVQVRATDRDGVVQTESEAPANDGATGWHRVRVRVAP